MLTPNGCRACPCPSLTALNPSRSTYSIGLPQRRIPPCHKAEAQSFFGAICGLGPITSPTTGDLVLQAFSKRLAGVVRPTDAVARLGGDEFAIALAGVREQANARAVADKVLKAAHAPFEVNNFHVRIGASVGVAFSADPVSGWSDLVERADAQLLSAKACGKGQQQGATQ